MGKRAAKPIRKSVPYLISYCTGQDHLLPGDFFPSLLPSCPFAPSTRRSTTSHEVVTQASFPSCLHLRYIMDRTFFTAERSREMRLVPSNRWIISLIVMGMWSACGSSASLPQVTLFPQHGDPVRVSVEIANTEEKRQFGLMYRTDLPEIQGMLFLFPREGGLSFWMKNTPRSLDIIYINSAHTIVGIARNTTPFSEENLPSGKPAQFVLEVNGGFCQRHGVAEGDRIEFPKDLPLIR